MTTHFFGIDILVLGMTIQFLGMTTQFFGMTKEFPGVPGPRGDPGAVPAPTLLSKMISMRISSSSVRKISRSTQKNWNEERRDYLRSGSDSSTQTPAQQGIPHGNFGFLQNFGQNSALVAVSPHVTVHPREGDRKGSGR